MKKVFSKRYENLINDDNFITEFSRDLKIKLTNFLYEFNEPALTRVSRYDSYEIETSAEYEALKVYFDMHGWNSDDISKIDKQWYFTNETFELLDIVELWNDALSDSEKYPFQTEFNDLMEQFDMPWRLFDGRLIKIDSKQFEQDLRNKALLEMEQLSQMVPEFRNAYLEFLEACNNFTSKDNKYAILNACKSYESVLKVILNMTKGNADLLIKKFVESEYMNSLPSEVKVTGFQEKVLTSLPFLRNNLAGHGNGQEVYEVPDSIAKLSVNLAATLNTYLIDQYKANLVATQSKPAEVEKIDDDEIPF